MSFRYAILASAALAIASPVAYASDEAEVRVSGVIRPASCAISAGNGGDFDFGEINAQLIPAGSPTGQRPAPPKTTELSVECSSAARWALKAVDGRAGTSIWSPQPYSFGLGRADNGASIGAYNLVLAGGVADGKAASIAVSRDDGATWAAGVGADARIHHDGTLSGFNVSGVHAEGPGAIRSLTVNMELDLQLNRTSAFDLSNDIELDGAATIQLYML